MRALRVSFIAGVAALALIGAACGGGASDGGAGGETESPASAQEGGAPPPASVVVQEDYFFDPAEFSVTSGDGIEVENASPQTPHTFTVTGEDIDIALDPGESQKVTIDLPPGTYPFICRFHEGQGMVGTLTVG